LARHLLHDWVARFVSGTRRKRPLFGNNGFRRVVQAQQLPADRLIAYAAAVNLPDSHDGVVFFGEANSMDLYRSGIAIIPKFKDVA
jgi:hypothetical protein